MQTVHIERHADGGWRWVLRRDGREIAAGTSNHATGADALGDFRATQRADTVEAGGHTLKCLEPGCPTLTLEPGEESVTCRCGRSISVEHTA